MPILKIFICDICKEKFVEQGHGKGAEGWGQLVGIKLDGVDNPTLCPNHLTQAADFLDELKRKI